MNQQPDYAIQLVHLRAQLGRPHRKTAPEADRRRVERLDLALATRTNRIVSLRKEIADLEADLRWAEDEAEGYRKGLVLAMTELLTAMGPPRVVVRTPPQSKPSTPRPREVTETWSPVPVLGYRFWAIKGGAVYGFRSKWRTPHMDAVCRAFPGNRDIPHTDNRCGRLGCGVYAVKSLDLLLDAIARHGTRQFIVGLVGLEGKVVEHDLGYRAGSATVLAAAAVERERLLVTADESEIEALFAGPLTFLGTPLGGIQPTKNNSQKDLHDTIRTYLNDRAKERESWISATNNG